MIPCLICFIAGVLVTLAAMWALGDGDYILVSKYEGKQL